MMRATLPGCPGEDQFIAARKAAEEAWLDEVVSVEINLDIERAEVSEIVSMPRRRFQQIKAEMDTDELNSLFAFVDCGDIDFDEFYVDVNNFAIRDEAD